MRTSNPAARAALWEAANELTVEAQRLEGYADAMTVGKAIVFRRTVSASIPAARRTETEGSKEG